MQVGGLSGWLAGLAAGFEADTDVNPAWSSYSSDQLTDLAAAPTHRWAGDDQGEGGRSACGVTTIYYAVRSGFRGLQRSGSAVWDY
ncbi:hypothetical protein PF004_g30560 [Phytophthora fragariae]|uniref:Uncharacterized protein n=1 Tax=Phytophthora fragariae TaxID=53985 RepID=A0A6G0MBM1_9STRA|nr:hypothetical protein PF004_g30560 [Phytophthora fragariae]